MDIKTFYDSLQPDIQKYIVDEYVKPQLMQDEMIHEFDRIIESEECQRLNWRVLVHVVTKIIHCKPAITKMCELNALGFTPLKIYTFSHSKRPLFSVAKGSYEW
jgi:hypothetical protein